MFGRDQRAAKVVGDVTLGTGGRDPVAKYLRTGLRSRFAVLYRALPPICRSIESGSCAEKHRRCARKELQQRLPVEGCLLDRRASRVEADNVKDRFANMMPNTAASLGLSRIAIPFSPFTAILLRKTGRVIPLSKAPGRLREIVYRVQGRFRVTPSTADISDSAGAEAILDAIRKRWAWVKTHLRRWRLRSPQAYGQGQLHGLRYRGHPPQCGLATRIHDGSPHYPTAQRNSKVIVRAVD
ncbi:hypothetical protein ABIC65_000169 [Sphingomonas trueperi]